MEKRIDNPQSKHMLILVHGLNGSFESWEGTNERFIANLQIESLIENFDVYLYQYPTRIFEITLLKKIRNTIKGFSSNNPHEDLEGFNIGIDKISRNLEAEIRDAHHNYETISFIAHSMGGLVVKSAITWMPKQILEKVRLIISLSVPHMGANLANVGTGLFGKHPQLVDLKGMGEFTTTLNGRYANLKPQPKIFYQRGNYDTIVCEAAAIPGLIEITDTTTTPDDHFSVLLIKNPTNSHLFRTIIRELNKAIQPHQGIDLGIAEGTPVGAMLYIIASQLKIKIDYTTFTSEELSQQLRKGNIRGISAEEIIVAVGKLTLRPFPSYKIEKIPGTDDYIIKKTNQ